MFDRVLLAKIRSFLANFGDPKNGSFLGVGGQKLGWRGV